MSGCSKFLPSKMISGIKENAVSTEANEIFVSLKEQVTIWMDVYSSMSSKNTLIGHLSKPEQKELPQ